MEIKDIRLANLRQLIKREGAVSQLALRLQISPIYIYRVLDGKFTIGDSMARKIEDAYQHPHGWMDRIQHYEGTDASVLPPVPGREPYRARTNLPPAAYRAEHAAMSQGTVPKASPVNSGAGAMPAMSGSAQSILGDGHDNTQILRLIMGIIRALERLVAANRVKLTDAEKAKLLMKAAEKILADRSQTASAPSGTQEGKEPNPKNVRKIS